MGVAAKLRLLASKLSQVGEATQSINTSLGLPATAPLTTTVSTSQETGSAVSTIRDTMKIPESAPVTTVATAVVEQTGVVDTVKAGLGIAETEPVTAVTPAVQSYTTFAAKVKNFLGLSPSTSLTDVFSAVTQNAAAGTYYRCASLNAEAGTWTGYEAVKNEEGLYLYNETLTEGLLYGGNSFIPTPGGIFNAGCTVELKRIALASNTPLTLTAVKAESSVSLNIGSSIQSRVDIRYRMNGDTVWKPYTSGTVLTLENVGSFVQFINTATKLSTGNYTYGESYSARFRMSGEISASGKIDSMINYGDLTEGCLKTMFYSCNALVAAPAFPETDVTANSAYHSMFYNSGIRSIVLPFAKATGYLCCQSMLAYCGSLQMIEVNFTSWDDVSCDNWVEGVSSSGTFVKPAALPEEYGTSRIPEGWTVVNK